LCLSYISLRAVWEARRCVFPFWQRIKHASKTSPEKHEPMKMKRKFLRSSKTAAAIIIDGLCLQTFFFVAFANFSDYTKRKFPMNNLENFPENEEVGGT
jgi:hypothetical protein